MLPWYATKKYQTTNEIFTEWVNKVDQEMGQCQKKNTLVLDNCTTQTNDIQLDNIQLLFLHTNTTSVIQTLYYRIIKNFKTIYYQKVLCCIIHIKDNNSNTSENFNTSQLDKKIAIIDTIYMNRDVCRDVAVNMINNLFSIVGSSHFCDASMPILKPTPLPRLSSVFNSRLLKGSLKFSQVQEPKVIQKTSTSVNILGI